MDVSTAAIVEHLRGLAHAEDAEELAVVLMTLDGAARQSVPSFGGLEVRVRRHGQELLLVLAPGGARPWCASLRLPLGPLDADADPGSWVIWYATTPGAFVDLAADLGYALQLPLHTEVPAGAGVGPDGSGQDLATAVVVDADLPGPTAADLDGFSGLERVALIERATGVLIERGHQPDDARDRLRAAAVNAGVALHEHAGAILDGVVSDGSGSERDGRPEGDR